MPTASGWEPSPGSHSWARGRHNPEVGIEAELHLLAGRMQGARRSAAARGELRFPLPVGYVRDVDGNTVIDTDQEVAAAIADVFAAFQATGSAYAVVATF